MKILFSIVQKEFSANGRSFIVDFVTVKLFPLLKHGKRFETRVCFQEGEVGECCAGSHNSWERLQKCLHRNLI